MEKLTIGRATFTVETHHDSYHGAPWEEEDGHGPVSDWTTRAKEPGEFVLNSDRGSKRYYDFAAACKQARKEGWGFLPGKLIVDRFARSGKRKFRATVQFRRDLVAYGSDRNSAVSALYALHRSTMTARQYAAGAAMVDFERLRGWCNDSWSYVGIVVTHDATGETDSLWGIESDSDDYLQEVARDLAGGILQRIRKVA